MSEFLSPSVFAPVVTAAVFGGMLFFAAVFAPLVFVKLPADTAGAFIRQVFPAYYLSMAATSALAAALAAFGHLVDAAVLAAVAVGFVVARQVLMPAINRRRDAQLAGDRDAGRSFARLHRASVILNAAQLLAVLVVLVRLIV